MEPVWLFSAKLCFRFTLLIPVSHSPVVNLYRVTQDFFAACYYLETESSYFSFACDHLGLFASNLRCQL